MWVFICAEVIEHRPSGARFHRLDNEWTVTNDSCKSFVALNAHQDSAKRISLLELECNLWAHGRAFPMELAPCITATHCTAHSPENHAVNDTIPVTCVMQPV